MTSITPFLEAHLRLTVNTAKSAVDLPWRRAFMAKLSPLLKRSHEQSLTTTIRKLNPVLRSWVKYYRMTASKRPFEARNGWLRRRLRLILWLHWKRARTRPPRPDAVKPDRVEGLDECHEWSWNLEEQWRTPHELSTAKEGVQRPVFGKLANVVGRITGVVG